jgi:hypothetical protein
MRAGWRKQLPQGLNASVAPSLPSFSTVLQIDSEGKRVGKPQEETWMERASLVRDDEGNWLVKEVQAIEPAAAA